METISETIAKRIIADVHSRYGLEECFRSLRPKAQVAIYENWIEIISEELQKQGYIDEKYTKFDVEENDLVDIVNRIPSYFKEG